MKSHHWFRIGCIVNGAFFLAVGAALYIKAPWVTSLWPWPDVGMSYVFLASIGAAVAAPLIWIGATGELGALAGIGINSLVGNSAAAAYLAFHSLRGERGLLGSIALFTAMAALGALIYFQTRRMPIRDPRPMPRIVRWAFVAFAAMLIVTGAALILQLPRIFPWDLPAHSSSIFGFIFLGAAVYFIHGVTHPRWVFGAGQLWSFLAYDVVLFVPYFQMLLGDSSASAEDGYGSSGINAASLAVYLTVLTMSALLALYMFFVHPPTRVGAPRRRPQSDSGATSP